MEEWVSVIIGLGIVVVICCCGELARWVEQDDELTAARAAGLSPTQPRTYMGAPMRMQFKTFDVSSKKKKKKKEKKQQQQQQQQQQQKLAHIDDLTSLDLGSLTNIDTESINLTPRDTDGNKVLLSARQLANGARVLQQHSARRHPIAALKPRRQPTWHDLIRRHICCAAQSLGSSM